MLSKNSKIFAPIPTQISGPFIVVSSPVIITN